MICANCGTENERDRKFCLECGVRLALGCASCGAANAPNAKFCGECGAALSAQVSATTPTPVARLLSEPPAAERRLVSVLFADLVGFTTLSESRDSEEVRELLTRYFDTCRKLIARYGGVVEKFIGDAVMAVWGTPTAMEDDAERAVRAALELTTAVAGLGQDVGEPDLRARAGVLTGEAAVTIGAEGQGMVAGDLVNTASRIQSLAPPGCVYVGEGTVRSSDAAIAYEEAGVHELKGKAEQVPLWRAVRVVAGAHGALRFTGLEAPFVGRDRELRLIKELLHASGEERRAQLVTVTGIAGIGKSRLSWEFEKYVEGLADKSLWHRGRCLSYGEGVAYWALVDMVKMRCRIAEEEESASALAKLRATIEEFIPDAQERRWVEPRLAHLLAIEGGVAGDQENVFSAWRIFFERLAARYPVVMVFEDMQWADAGLLDFIEYLLEWSRNHPIFIVALARPELADKRPSWGGGKRSFSSLYLEPLSEQAMEELLSGLVPGLPDDLREQILDRAQGVPLYAVETVRMLLDRGLLVRDGSVYHPTGPIEFLEVPETLHALIAARLDGLGPEERRVVQDGAVLGKTFFKQGIARVSGMTEEELERLLSSLVRKEILSLQADPRSPERGQYGFLQDLVKKVAYETLSRKERKAKHLAAAGFIEEGWTGEEDEIVEVVAAHYLSAYEAVPDAPDAKEIRTRARERLVLAGDRAASLAATRDAQRYFEQAVQLTNDPDEQGELHERAGLMARAGGRAEEAADHFEKSMALFEGAGATHPAARVAARLADVMWDRGRLEQGLELMERSYQVLSKEEPDEDLAWLAAQLGRLVYFAGRTDEGAERIEKALQVAEALWLPEVLSHALNTKGLILNAWARPNEARALMRHALDIALECDRPSAALRAYFNIAEMFTYTDRYLEAERFSRDGLLLARRVGNRYWEWSFLGQAYPFFCLGKWDDAMSGAAELPLEDWNSARGAFVNHLTSAAAIMAHRGELGDLRKLIDVFADMETSADVQERAVYAVVKSFLLLCDADDEGALSAAEVGFALREWQGAAHEAIKESFGVVMEAAFRLSDFERVEMMLGFVDALPPGLLSRFYQAQSMRFRARLADRRGETEKVEELLTEAGALFREILFPFYLGVTLLEHGEWLAGLRRFEDARPLLDEANGIFELLRAKPWLERLERLSPAETSVS